MLTMVLVLGFSAICSASNGKVLDAEEAMVNKFLAASNYSAVTSMMTDGMKKDFTEEVFKNFKEQMDKNFGAFSIYLRFVFPDLPLLLHGVKKGKMHLTARQPRPVGKIGAVIFQNQFDQGQHGDTFGIFTQRPVKHFAVGLAF